MGLYGQKLLVEKRKRRQDSRNTTRVSKRQWRTVSSRLASSNIYSVLCPEKLENKISGSSNTEGVREVWRILQPLREVWMGIELEELENHEGVVVNTLLNSGATGLFMDTQFAKRKGFKLERLKTPLLVWNIDRTVNVGGEIMY